MVLNAFTKEIFPLQSTETIANLGMLDRVAEISDPLRSSDLARFLKKWSLKPMLQRSAKALEHVKAGNTSAKLLN